MLKSHLRTILLGGMIALFGGASAAPCQAGPVLDWLTGRRTVYYSSPWYASSGYYTTYRPATFWGTRRIAGYAPFTTYRTSWARVPVTYYRPVSTIDPATGVAVTTMRPCTSHSWQLRRVPYTTARTVFAPSYFGSPCATGCATPCATPCATGCATYATPAYDMASSCNGCGVTTTVPATPYYTPGPATISTPAPASPAPIGPTPADRAPSLKPSDGQPAVQGAAHQQQVQKPAPAKTAEQPLSAPFFRSKPPRPSFDLRPVPDPDAPKTKAAPQLINPRDRTAQAAPRRNRVVRASASIPAKAKPWDDSGWRSANR